MKKILTILFILSVVSISGTVVQSFDMQLVVLLDPPADENFTLMV
jgi:hypothetical protein